MKRSEVVQKIENSFEGIVIKHAFSETTFFYNPGHLRPHGVYFLTIKDQDGPNDKASNLDRDGVFRISFKPDPATYQRYFGNKPRRPLKGKAIDLPIDFSELDKWMPHSVYAWMGWTMILSPTKKSLEQLWPDLDQAYILAKAKFENG